MEWTNQELQELNQKLHKKAAEDAAFRQELLTNPTETIEKFCGKKLPKEIPIHVIESGDVSSPELTQPDLIGRELDQEELLKELGEEELQSVSGGFPVLFVLLACAAAVNVVGVVGACGAQGCVANFCDADACGAAGGVQ